MLGPLGPQPGRSQSEVCVVDVVLSPLYVAFQVDEDIETDSLTSTITIGTFLDLAEVIKCPATPTL